MDMCTAASWRLMQVQRRRLGQRRACTGRRAAQGGEMQNSLYLHILPCPQDEATHRGSSAP